MKKEVSNLAEKETSNALDFANMLLAKHEAKMRERELEGLYSAGGPTSVSPSKNENLHIEERNKVGVTVFQSHDTHVDADRKKSLSKAE